jgi:hypothetical protein
MTHRHRLVFVLGALIAAGSAQAAGWRSYHNDRFGTSADYPQGWVMGSAPENDDGRAFTSPDNKANITISGIFSSPPVADEIAERLKPDDGETITFHVQKPNGVTVSGTKGDMIFYRKSILSCGIWNDLVVDYPAAQKAAFDPIVTHIAASLKAGRGSDFVPCKTR